mmetsp:Transcript_30377/g.56962  ORF Transcript_30377/g.56962 Transcript_30377/m.56962 type:complete len:202 (-) Transcript_30377:503-1108(-)
MLCWMRPLPMRNLCVKVRKESSMPKNEFERSFVRPRALWRRTLTLSTGQWTGSCSASRTARCSASPPTSGLTRWTGQRSSQLLQRRRTHVSARRHSCFRWPLMLWRDGTDSRTRVTAGSWIQILSSVRWSGQQSFLSQVERRRRLRPARSFLQRRAQQRWPAGRRLRETSATRRWKCKARRKATSPRANEERLMPGRLTLI